MLRKEELINNDNSKKKTNHLNFVILKKNLHATKYFLKSFFFTIYLIVIFHTAQSFLY